jgi:hypothetical protein
MPTLKERWGRRRRALAYASFNLLTVILFSALGWQPRWLWLPYLLKWLEVKRGIQHLAMRAKPTKIGWRQLTVSTLFTILFVVVY